MTPIPFEGSNIIIAEGQPEYRPLPAHRSKTYQGVVTTCWEMTLKERLQALWTGKVWARQMAYGKPLQPIDILTERPALVEPG